MSFTRQNGTQLTTETAPPETLNSTRTPSSTRTSGKGCCGGGLIGGIVSRVKSVGAAAVDFWQDGMALATDAQDAHRAAVCDVCPIRQGMLCAAPPDGCGCVLALKRKARAAACPQRKWFAHTDSYQPFTREPTRNLVMHVWPTRNGAWRWNLDQILRRIDLFNGKRILGIVTDSATESADAVREHVAGHGFEFIVAENNPKLGEVVTFVPSMERVASLDPNEVFFRCHTKGAKHPHFGGPSHSIKHWAEIMYETCLDDWPSVADALESHTVAGSFKRYSGLPGPYHFSGSFYWGRSSGIFSRNWRKIYQQYAGAEIWPTRVASNEEAACLFGDNAGNLYDVKLFDGPIQQELERWRAARALTC